MSLPSQAEYVIVGAGIHGLSTAWRLAERLTASGESVEGRIVIVDKADRIAAGATGIACGVVRNNYFQPAMRKLMAHSVSVWESDPEAFSYHANGYMQISCEKMREDVKQIHAEQKAIGYESVFIEGEEESREYMLNLFDDWQAQGITSVLHEKLQGQNWKQIVKALKDVGAPTTAKEIGLRPEILAEALLIAQSLRPKRYTILKEVDMTYRKAILLAKSTKVL